jgi:hypothetical protein
MEFCLEICTGIYLRIYFGIRPIIYLEICLAEKKSCFVGICTCSVESCTHARLFIDISRYLTPPPRLVFPTCGVVCACSTQFNLMVCVLLRLSIQVLNPRLD